ncbi:hypothetical protein E2P81_ATG06057 [Venturia nashicola]|uniref:Uncharacterized protein n=1 Tax=Venturia nashicola TaxID=86259 RepID=A0A4Z1PA05_9PEZI|nr:hypothetical protein E6O75_ATG06200 [Venturia nashicola]TLD29763.1 hypothetical protein E2P81_ATG06057 [Venturia nashicola]
MAVYLAQTLPSLATILTSLILQLPDDTASNAAAAQGAALECSGYTMGSGRPHPLYREIVLVPTPQTRYGPDMPPGVSALHRGAGRLRMTAVSQAHSAMCLLA